MTTYDFGDIVLVAFPFTDQTTTKKRPAAKAAIMTLASRTIFMK